MNGEISQLVALCTAANRALANASREDFKLQEHVDFAYCNSVRFVDLEKSWFGKRREVERHRDPNDWLRSLHDVRSGRAWLTFAGSKNTDVIDHQLAGFAGGGGRWTLTLVRDNTTEIWVSRWQVVDENAVDGRGWDVTYGCVSKFREALKMPDADLDTATRRLRSALSEIRDFAAKHEHSWWSEIFQRAIDCTGPSTSITFPDYVEFIDIDRYSEAAQRLFSAVYNGWCFGGMGSWNDLVFDSTSDKQRYDEVSAELYGAMNEAIQSATRSFRHNGL